MTPRPPSAQRLIYLDGDHTLSGLWTVPALSVAGDLSVRSLNGQLPERLLRLDGTIGNALA